jgi:hypothetical protein
VHDAGVVRRRQRLGGLHRVLEREENRKRSTLSDELSEIDSLHHFEGDPGRSLVLANTVHPDDARVFDRRQRPRLTQKARARRRRRRVGRDQAQHELTAVGAMSQVEVPAVGSRQAADDDIGTDGGARVEAG